MKKTKKSILKKCIGKGGMDFSSFKQASSPINLLKAEGQPPTAQQLEKSPSNS